MLKNIFEIIIYEPNISNICFEGIEIENNIERFKDRSDLIVANRLDDELIDVKAKVFLEIYLKKINLLFPFFKSCIQYTKLAGWQSGYAAACKAVYAGSIPASASNFIKTFTYIKV